MIKVREQIQMLCVWAFFFLIFLHLNTNIIGVPYIFHGRFENLNKYMILFLAIIVGWGLYPLFGINLKEKKFTIEYCFIGYFSCIIALSSLIVNYSNHNKFIFLSLLLFYFISLIYILLRRNFKMYRQ